MIENPLSPLSSLTSDLGHAASVGVLFFAAKRIVPWNSEFETFIF
jgi:hypothetical protein